MMNHSTAIVRQSTTGVVDVHAETAWAYFADLNFTLASPVTIA